MPGAGKHGCACERQLPSRRQPAVRLNPPAATPPHPPQVHTTGVDVQQAPGVTAALTLGKDMTWRDYTQGAWRMRQIGKGQRLDVLITPEAGF